MQCRCIFTPRRVYKTPLLKRQSMVHPNALKQKFKICDFVGRRINHHVAQPLQKCPSFTPAGIREAQHFHKITKGHTLICLFFNLTNSDSDWFIYLQHNQIVPHYHDLSLRFYRLLESQQLVYTADRCQSRGDLLCSLFCSRVQQWRKKKSGMELKPVVLVHGAELVPNTAYQDGIT